ncbi:MAG: hypothetical protein QM802_11595 [Agriterribacter sp.]
MNKIFVRLILCFFPVCVAKAQVNISVNEPPAGVIQKAQLWNLSLIYSGTGTMDVIVGITLVDMNDNQPVLTAYSRALTLAKGIKVVKSADVAPIDYTYTAPGFNRLLDPFIPIGNYRACYSVYAVAKEMEYTLAENCINLEIQPLTPPQLAMPSDSATLQNVYPQFSWLPPAPVSLFTDLNYELLVTEIRDDQTASAAIQENLPIYNARRLATTVNNYPSSNKALDTGKTYAWRIIAKNGETFAAQSEVWTFHVAKEQPVKKVDPINTYLELKGEGINTSTGIVKDNALNIKFYSYDKTHEAVINVFNARREKIKDFKRTISYGNNFLAFKLDEAFQKETTYFIEITDLQNTIHKASFQISN